MARAYSRTCSNWPCGTVRVFTILLRSLSMKALPFLLRSSLNSLCGRRRRKPLLPDRFYTAAQCRRPHLAQQTRPVEPVGRHVMTLLPGIVNSKIPTVHTVDRPAICTHVKEEIKNCLNAFFSSRSLILANHDSINNNTAVYWSVEVIILVMIVIIWMNLKPQMDIVTTW